MAENNRVIDPSGSAVKAARGGLDLQQLSVKKNDKGYAWLFLGPSLLLLIVFIFYPMLKTLYLSLFLTNGNGQNTVFVGLQNYMTLLTSATYFASLFATLIYVLAVSLLTIILGLLLASTASKNVRGSSFF